MGNYSYAKAGVDLRGIKQIHKLIRREISRTYSTKLVCKIISGFGHYAGLLEFGTKVLAIHSDGVGTKILIAGMMKKYDSIGIDCVAMNVNDVICVGAMPIGFVDYIALREPNSQLVNEIIRGISKGAIDCNMPIIGGETAIVPDLLNEREVSSFDLVGTILGMTDKKQLILGTKVKEDDVILGVESNGLHSNGYTLARKVLLSKYHIEDCAQFIGGSIGQELIRPTRIYFKPVTALLETVRTKIHGLAHITGGSFMKLSRLNVGMNYKLDNLPAPRGIFKQILEDGKLKHIEMYRTFNMGIGFCIILPKTTVKIAEGIFEENKMFCTEIGRVAKGTGKVAALIEGKLRHLNIT